MNTYPPLVTECHELFAAHARALANFDRARQARGAPAVNDPTVDQQQFDSAPFSDLQQMTRQFAISLMKVIADYAAQSFATPNGIGPFILPMACVENLQTRDYRDFNPYAMWDTLIAHYGDGRSVAFCNAYAVELINQQIKESAPVPGQPLYFADSLLMSYVRCGEKGLQPRDELRELLRALNTFLTWNGDPTFDVEKALLYIEFVAQCDTTYDVLPGILLYEGGTFRVRLRLAGHRTERLAEFLAKYREPLCPRRAA